MSSEEEKQVLGLQLPTDPRWANLAEKSLEEILTDHAYCEQKAASSCISLIIQYPDMAGIVDTLTPIVQEEWSHFERVIAELKKRGHSLGRQRKDEYVHKINDIVRKGGSREQQLVEKLLMGALIEARSCERFRQLWKFIEDKELSEFYYELLVSEAGHYKTFLELARKFMPAEYVEKRWREILIAEAKIITSLEVRGDRMH
ncbi:MAG: tRNA-(ms[2]io[6]A)-hydroxylase [Cyclobacteriaceae bacterium]|nr:tRNA-(ms[2]io[6]A)-hydroxylase [Cyclobacteriaceae bacterium]